MSITSKSDPTVVSLFAGCGGSSLGYKQAGYDVRLAVEWDKGAADVYRRNFPKTNVFEGDIADLTAEEALRVTALEPGGLDVLDGSPPCQGFSVAGKRRFSDTRNRLFEEYVRMIEVFKPKMLIMENVSGLRKGKMKLVFAEMTKALKDTGYKVSCRELNAWWYGVPQDRHRLIWVGVREDLAAVPGHPEPTVTVPVSAGRALGATETRIASFGNPVFLTRPENAGRWRPMQSLVATLAAMQPPSITEGESFRYLTIEESKTLQGFPEWFDIREKEYKFLGNSVCPPMAEAVGRHLITLLEEA
jgi:DNA (cytosine-5)-methyltransferase 1